MKFGVIGSIAKPTLPQTTGGMEVWTSLFLLESIKRGITFDLYALPGSLQTEGKINLVEISKKGIDEIRQDGSFSAKHPREYESTLLIDIYFSRMMVLLKEKQAEYDLIINSSVCPLFPINWDLYKAPLLTIGHFAAAEPYASYFEYFPLPPHIFYAFPSRREFDLATWIPEQQKFHIPHGIDVSKIPFEENIGKNMVWIGRLDPSMQKGAPQAITLSNKMNIPLDIYTYIEDEKYFESSIQPLLTKNIHLQTGVARTEYFKDAKLFLFPLQWEEPFGLTIVEAMASGTPVVAYAKGAVPEIIKDGKTGFIVNASAEDQRGDWIIKQTGEAGMMEAIQRIYAMPAAEYQAMKKTCREHVEKNFSIEKMVDGYQSAYSQIMGQKN